MFSVIGGRGFKRLLRPISLWLLLLLGFCQSKGVRAEHMRETPHDGDLFRANHTATEPVVLHSTSLGSHVEANRILGHLTGLSGQGRFHIFKIVVRLIILSELRIYSVPLEHP